MRIHKLRAQYWDSRVCVMCLCVQHTRHTRAAEHVLWVYGAASHICAVSTPTDCNDLSAVAALPCTMCSITHTYTNHTQFAAVGGRPQRGGSCSACVSARWLHFWYATMPNYGVTYNIWMAGGESTRRVWFTPLVPVEFHLHVLFRWKWATIARSKSIKLFVLYRNLCTHTHTYTPMPPRRVCMAVRVCACSVSSLVVVVVSAWAADVQRFLLCGVTDKEMLWCDHTLNLCLQYLSTLGEGGGWPHDCFVCVCVCCVWRMCNGLGCTPPPSPSRRYMHAVHQKYVHRMWLCECVCGLRLRFLGGIANTGNLMMFLSGFGDYTIGLGAPNQARTHTHFTIVQHGG